jgi:voltage-gated potassium channel
MSPESKLRLALLFLVLIVSIGTIGYSVIEHWSVFDSLFMTIITLSTVGYGVVRPLSEAGEIFTMFLIVFGAFNGGLIVAALAQLILEGQLLTILGKRKMEKKVQRLKNHIILCGFGRVGKQVAQEFSRLDVPFVIIEKEIVNIPEPGASDMMFIQGDVADDDVLEQARIRQARAIVSTLPDDADNVYLALTARQINPGMVIIARAESDLAKRKLHRAGADRVISPHELGGMQMAMATLRPNVVDFMRLAAIDPSHQGLSIEEIPIRPGSTLAGQSLIEAAIKTQYDIIVVGLRKNSGSVVFNPPGETVMEPGDILVALGETDKLERLGADLG